MVNKRRKLNPVAVFLKSFYKSKTMFFALLLTVFGAVADQLEIIKPLMTAENFSKFTLFISVAVAVLRYYTTTHLVDKVHKSHLDGNDQSTVAG